ncbi:hypothetical protein C3B55_00387 [Candidatus Pseudomonas adelgestsugas]|uniref:Uncharacterized protein n=1 Tax=Candidatus Pseudomonas adelgestsugas TaxID=1302376 RepID=A0ABX5R8B3_9PSED|nr:hypothetical protein C3B55_00387 [Candidatus Pseudomonas adelgestsugas]
MCVLLLFDKIYTNLYHSLSLFNLIFMRLVLKKNNPYIFYLKELQQKNRGFFVLAIRGGLPQ